jgi:hypothetical protein
VEGWGISSKEARSLGFFQYTFHVSKDRENGWRIKILETCQFTSDIKKIYL